MKKIFLLGVYFFCLSKVVAHIPASIEELKKTLQPLLLQQYDAKRYSWAYSAFDDIYTKNYSLYRKSSYIASQEIFIPLFEALNKRIVDTSKEIVSVTYNKDQKLIIVGSLYGGAQCLMDYIEHWQASGIMHNDLVLKKNYSIFFLGNAIGKSPYSLETLAIIGLLIYKNQNNVVFIQGEQEYQESWIDHSLGGQIINTQQVAVSVIYKNLINTFFAHCPRAVFISFDNNGTHKILCVPSLQQALLYMSKDIDVVMSGVGDDVVMSNVSDVIVRGNNTGLFIMAPIFGATNWKVFSACTPMMKEYYNFSTHSYVLCDQKTITHVYRTEREKEYQKSMYNIYTGLLDIEDKKICKIGSSIDFSGQLGNVGLSLVESIFIALLEQSKIIGSKDLIREYIFNDTYIPYKTYTNVKQLKKQGITTLLLPLGTANVEMFLPEIKKSELLVLFPIMDGRYPEIKNMIHYRVSYMQESEALIKNLLSKNYIKNIAIFYQDDAFGVGSRDVAHTILKENNVSWVDVPYSRTDISFSPAADKIRQANVDAIAFFAISDAANGLIKELKPYTLVNKKLVGLSILLLNGFDKVVSKLGIDFTFASVVPNPLTSTIEIAIEYRKIFEKNAYTPDVASFEGYIATQLFLEAFKAANNTLDHQKIVHYFENIKNMNFKGLSLTFNSLRGLSNTVWLMEGADNSQWIPYVFDVKK